MNGRSAGNWSWTSLGPNCNWYAYGISRSATMRKLNCDLQRTPVFTGRCCKVACVACLLPLCGLSSCHECTCVQIRSAALPFASGARGPQKTQLCNLRCRAGQQQSFGGVCEHVCCSLAKGRQAQAQFRPMLSRVLCMLMSRCCLGTLMPWYFDQHKGILQSCRFHGYAPSLLVVDINKFARRLASAIYCDALVSCTAETQCCRLQMANASN